jgi:large subunit ribosomal protein L20
MARVKRGVTAHAKHKKVLEQAKGFYGRRKNTIRTAKAAVDKAGQYAYRDRKVKQAQLPQPCGSSASTPRRVWKASPTRSLSTALIRPGSSIDRKVLSDIAGHDPVFKAIADKVRAALKA